MIEFIDDNNLCDKINDNDTEMSPSSAKAVNCGKDETEVLVETGPNFGGGKLTKPYKIS